MSYKLLWEEKGIRCIFEKEYTSHDELKSNKEIIEDSRFPLIEYAIYDFTDVTKFPIDSLVIREAGHMDAKAYKSNPRMKLAIVANKIVMKGITNMYRTYAELANDDITWDIQYFEEMGEAEKWVIT